MNTSNRFSSDKPMQVLLTGAGGFVGQHFVKDCPNDLVIRTVSLRDTLPAMIDYSGIDTVIHLAGKAHDLENPASPEYHRVNTELTCQLADAAKQAGVRHFIFISTIKVYGNEVDVVLSPETVCHPDDDYGLSKRNAEIYLQSIEEERFTVSIVRPPLVYGAGVKGNMAKLMALCRSDKWLPLGNINNRRSMVYVGNLNAMIMAIARQQQSGIFLPGDAQPISTTELVCMMRRAMGLPEKTRSIPGWLRWLIKIVKPQLHKRLFSSLEADTRSTFARLNFTPPFSTEAGLAAMVNHTDLCIR